MFLSCRLEFLELFTRYNEDLWPLHVVAYAMGVAAVGLLFARRRWAADRVIAGLLAALWLWLGVVFQGLYATDVNVALGTAYAVMFVIQAYLLFRHGVLRGALAFRPWSGIGGAAGWGGAGLRRARLPPHRRRPWSRLAGVTAAGNGALPHHDRDLRAVAAHRTTHSPPTSRGPVRVGGPGTSRGDGPGRL